MKTIEMMRKELRQKDPFANHLGCQYAENLDPSFKCPNPIIKQIFNAIIANAKTTVTENGRLVWVSAELLDKEQLNALRSKYSGSNEKFWYWMEVYMLEYLCERSFNNYKVDDNDRVGLSAWGFDRETHGIKISSPKMMCY